MNPTHAYVLHSAQLLFSELHYFPASYGSTLLSFYIPGEKKQRERESNWQNCHSQNSMWCIVDFGVYFLAKYRICISPKFVTAALFTKVHIMCTRVIGFSSWTSTQWVWESDSMAENQWPHCPVPFHSLSLVALRNSFSFSSDVRLPTQMWLRCSRAHACPSACRAACVLTHTSAPAPHSHHHRPCGTIAVFLLSIKPAPKYFCIETHVARIQVEKRQSSICRPPPVPDAPFRWIGLVRLECMWFDCSAAVRLLLLLIKLMET